MWYQGIYRSTGQASRSGFELQTAGQAGKGVATIFRFFSFPLFSYFAYPLAIRGHYFVRRQEQQSLHPCLRHEDAINGVFVQSGQFVYDYGVFTGNGEFAIPANQQHAP